MSVSIAEGVRDVTWRYNNQHENLKEARKSILIESWLRDLIRLSHPKNVIQGQWYIAAMILKVFVHLITGWDKSQQHKDWIDEAVEFLNPPTKINSSNLKERQSGSAQWRQRLR